MRGQEQNYQSSFGLQSPLVAARPGGLELLESNIFICVSKMLPIALTAQFMVLVAALPANNNASTSCRDAPVRKEW